MKVLIVDAKHKSTAPYQWLGNACVWGEGCALSQLSAAPFQTLYFFYFFAFCVIYGKCKKQLYMNQKNKFVMVMTQNLKMIESLIMQI